MVMSRAFGDGGAGGGINSLFKNKFSFSKENSANRFSMYDRSLNLQSSQFCMKMSFFFFSPLKWTIEDKIVRVRYLKLTIHR